MLNEHLSCPKCEYDLFGIPEVRCPECGFRYDRSALISMAVSAEWTRWAAAREIIVKATIAGAVVIPIVCNRLGIGALGLWLISSVACVAAFITWLILTDAYRGWGTIPNLMLLHIGGAFVLFSVLSHPALAIFCSSILIALSWVIRLYEWSTLLPLDNAGSDELRKSVIRLSYTATSLLILASSLLLVALIG